MEMGLRSIYSYLFVYDLIIMCKKLTTFGIYSGKQKVVIKHTGVTLFVGRVERRIFTIYFF